MDTYRAQRLDAPGPVGPVDDDARPLVEVTGPVPEPGTVEEVRWLSAVLFAAREQISMWGDVIEARAGVRDVDQGVHL